jgi:proline dehydrogenase
MQKYNINKAVIFTTYQMYLKNAYERLTTDMKRANQDGYYFAAKLVRGAYMNVERERASDMGYESPILPTIEDTHTSYNNGITHFISQIAEGKKVELMVASHNQQSCEKVAELCDKYNLRPEDSPIYFGQLLGMADHLTYTLASKNFKAYKYVPYGKIVEVMPYLIRRAHENSNIITSGVGNELRMLRKEIKRRIFG